MIMFRSLVSFIRMCYNKHIINTQLIVQKCMIKPLNVTLNFL